MNEHIKELIEDSWDYDTNSFDKERFAVLLIKACAEIADLAEPYKANDLILKHFGVKA